MLKGYIRSIISGSFADTSVKYTTIHWNICVFPSTNLHAVIQMSCYNFSRQKNFIQIMINATIMVKVLIYKLLMNVKMRTKQKYFWWNLEINKTYHLCIIHQMCAVSIFIKLTTRIQDQMTMIHISLLVQQFLTTISQRKLEIDHYSKL